MKTSFRVFLLLSGIWCIATSAIMLGTGIAPWWWAMAGSFAGFGAIWSAHEVRS